MPLACSSPCILARIVGDHNRRLDPPSGQFESTGSHLLLPGESVQLWGFYAAPPADVTTVDVEIGGLAMVAPTLITG